MKEGATRVIQLPVLPQNNKPATTQAPQPTQSQVVKPAQGYKIKDLELLIKKAYNDLNSRDPMGKRLYLNQVLNYILDWLPKAMAKGVTLFDAQKIVRQDLEKACNDYPIATIKKLKTTVEPFDKGHPDLFGDVKNKTKQTFTDRIKEMCQRSKQVSYEFNKEMQLILQKDGGHKFLAGYKFTGTKAYLRIMTKILDDFLSEEQQSKQVYTNLNHYYYSPVFKYFNLILDKNIKNIKVELYDWIRCKCSYNSVQELERAYNRLKSVHGNNIFRVKNRINQNTRDLFINLKYKSEYTEIQLALEYDDLSYQFQHKLYELTREKLGIAYSCFTFMLSEGGDHHGGSGGLMTGLGYLKKTLLREKVQPNFQRLSYDDALKILQEVKKVSGKKAFVALRSGYVDASDNASPLKKDSYGPDTEEMLIIKKKSANNPLYNWLNWFS